MAEFLVTGGRGLLGGQVVPQLVAAGHGVRVLARTARDAGDGVRCFPYDLVKGESPARPAGGVAAGDVLAEALTGVDTLVHLAGGPKGDDVATRRLVAAARAAGVRHIVYISVIGADAVPIAWFRTKLAAETAIADSGIPYTILRAAQFHELTYKAVATMAKLPVVPKPGGLRFQPVDSRDVAARVAALALAAPAGRVPDIAGPTVYPMAELVRGYLTARGKHRASIPVRIPGKMGKAYRAGDNLTLAGAPGGVELGAHTWEDFLAAKAAA